MEKSGFQSDSQWGQMLRDYREEKKGSKSMQKKYQQCMFNNKDITSKLLLRLREKSTGFVTVLDKFKNEKKDKKYCKDKYSNKLTRGRDPIKGLINSLIMISNK